MNRTELSKAIEAEALTLKIGQVRFSAVQRLFDAACMADDPTEADHLRVQLHNMLDEQLDTTATMLTLFRILSEQKINPK